MPQVPYGVDKAAWDKAIQQPVHALEESGRARLLTVLQRIMIRASKADLRSIPPCWRRATTLKFAPEHARSYNQLVEVIRRNLLLAGERRCGVCQFTVIPASRRPAFYVALDITKYNTKCGVCFIQCIQRPYQ